MVERFADNPDFAVNFCHQYFYTKSIVGGLHEFNRQVLLPFLRDYQAYVLADGYASTRLVKPGSNKVFIVHGFGSDPVAPRRRRTSHFWRGGGVRFWRFLTVGDGQWESADKRTR